MEKAELLVKYYNVLDKNVKLNFELVQKIIETDGLKWENQMLKEKIEEFINKDKESKNGKKEVDDGKRNNKRI